MIQGKGYIGRRRGAAWYVSRFKRGVFRAQGGRIVRPTTLEEDALFDAHNGGSLRPKKMSELEAAAQVEDAVPVQVDAVAPTTIVIEAAKPDPQLPRRMPRVKRTG